MLALRLEAQGSHDMARVVREHIVIYDHAPYPGPGHWGFMCRICDYPISQHAKWFQRWLWRRRQ